MSCRRKSFFVALAVIALSLAPTVGIGRADAAPSVTAPEAVVILDGVRIPAIPGAIVKSGTLDSDGNCQGLARTVEVRAPLSTAFASVQMDVTSSCQLRVLAVAFDTVVHQAPMRPAGAVDAVPKPRAASRAERRPVTVLAFQAAALIGHEIWSDHSFFEQLGVKVTEVYNRWQYSEDPYGVYLERRVEAWCWTDPFGWHIDSCTWNDLSSTPSWVNTNTHGDFHNECCGGIYHGLQANGWGQPGAWSFWCNFTGSAPPFWHDNCTGGRNF